MSCAPCLADEPHAATKIVESGLASKPIESSIDGHGPQQPVTPLAVRAFEARERVSVVAEAEVNCGHKHLRHVFPTADFVQFARDFRSEERRVGKGYMY